MRIDNSRGGVDRVEDKAAGGVGGSKEAAQADKAKPDVVVSSQASEVSAAAEKSKAEHAAKVAAIKAQLDEGRYRIDYVKVAQKMVEDEMARHGKK